VLGPNGTKQELDYYPFGGERVITSTRENHYKFTGLERDAESGLDHTLFRQYAWNLGRWLSPDPDGGAVINPQSLNRYAYVLNNPTNLIDPLGLQGGGPHCLRGSSGQCVDPHTYYTGPTPGTNFGCPGCNMPWHTPGLTDFETYLSNGLFLRGPTAHCPAEFAACVQTANGIIGLTSSGQAHGLTFGESQSGEPIEGFDVEDEPFGTVGTPDLTPCFGGDALCDSAGNVVRVQGNIESDAFANTAMAGAAYAAWDVGMIQAGRLFGTRIAGKKPLFNANDYLRIGWSFDHEYHQYVFRIGGSVVGWIQKNKHVNLWPPSWWGGRP